MTERHTVAIDLEKLRIGCLECDEWQPILHAPVYGFEEILCRNWRNEHLKRLGANND